MTSIENYKKSISPGLRKFFERYESDVKQLLLDLKSKGFLGTSFSEKSVERLTDIVGTSNGALGLSNDFSKVLMSGDEKKIRGNIKKLKETGWDADENRIFLQYGIVLSLSYHAFLERLKNYFISFIRWDLINTKKKRLLGVGDYLEVLKEYYPNNSFLNYFNSGIRNSIAHFTFFWKNGRIYFCKNLDDPSPTPQSLDEFIIETHNVSSLVEGFFLAYMDFLGMPPTNDFVN